MLLYLNCLLSARIFLFTVRHGILDLGDSMIIPAMQSKHVYHVVDHGDAASQDGT